MSKKLITVWLALIMILTSSISVFADTTSVVKNDVQGDFFEKHVILNGHELVNYNLQYPFVMVGNNTYIPATKEIGEMLGFKASMDWESHTLTLQKTDITRTQISNNVLKNNNVDITLSVVQEVTVNGVCEVPVTNESVAPGDGNNLVSDLAIIETVAEEGPEDAAVILEEEKTTTASIAMDLAGLDVLAVGKNIYVPLRLFTQEPFNWDLYFDPYYGICISSVDGVKAQSFVYKKEASVNRGLVAYIKKTNGNVKTSVAQRYVFLFKRAQQVYGVDYVLLMSIASKESTFNANAVSSSGAYGMMQVMKSTGARFGLSTSQLLDPKTSIDFGAKYVSSFVNSYNGDVVMALCAYSCGPGNVKKGNYNTRYATRVLNEYNNIAAFLTNNGYM